MKFILLVTILVFFLSCSKSGDSPSENNATLSYKVHDTTVVIPDKGVNIYMNKTGILGTYQYAFSGSYKNSQSQLEGFIFVAMTDSLKEGTYIFDSVYFTNSNKDFTTIGIIHDGITYLPPIDINNGNFTMTITNYSEGKINGTFSGTLFSVDHEILNVSEGQFKNVKVYY